MDNTTACMNKTLNALTESEHVLLSEWDNYVKEYPDPYVQPVENIGNATCIPKDQAPCNATQTFKYESPPLADSQPQVFIQAHSLSGFLCYLDTRGQDGFTVTTYYDRWSYVGQPSTPT